ncbi:MAG: hypothetical protein U9N44_02370 [Chloroflexota bacterium]|nr:hypothetical protein [Chloroflexota bacterium]
MQYVIAVVVGILILYVIYEYITSAPKRKWLREQEQERQTERAIIQDVLNGFNIKSEKEKTKELLRETLPIGYRCGRRGCSGMLFKRGNWGGNYYICSKCNNMRTRIKKSELHW